MNHDEARQGRQSVGGRIEFDRWIAIGLIVLALLYAAEAHSFQPSLLADPVGPRAFPLMLAGLLAFAALGLGLRPTGHAPTWPPASGWKRAGVASGSFIAYAYLIEPLGYLLSTGAVVVIISMLLGGRIGESAAAAIALVGALYVLFAFLLGLYLPPFPAL